MQWRDGKNNTRFAVDGDLYFVSYMSRADAEEGIFENERLGLVLIGIQDQGRIVVAYDLTPVMAR